MNDFSEAVIQINVSSDVAEVYKKAIEAENSPNGLRDHWNGNYAYVAIGTKASGENSVDVTVQLLSHTLPNLKETVNWYKEMGAEVIRTKYRTRSGLEETYKP
jgi:hypothetical protein|nr:MAG TPA: hypothetical protein [Caudoviricetes sp.]